jgi:hypothetical protein
MGIFIAYLIFAGFANKYNATYHCTKKAISRESIECFLCTKKLSNLPGLERHLISHHGTKTSHSKEEESYECKLCKTKLKSKRTFTLHMRNHLRLVKEEFQCKKCDKFFGTERTLSNHISMFHP